MVHESVVVNIVKPADGEEKLATGEVARQPGLRRQVDDAATNLQFFVNRAPSRHSINAHDTMLWRKHACRHAKQRRFSNAVGADDDRQFTALDAQIDMPQHWPHAVVLANIDELDHGIILALLAGIQVIRTPHKLLHSLTMTLLYRDSLFLKHDTGQHPETAN